ncbi:lipid IV(A) 3-deoxy-D-manno-octulosonic acid transferase [Microbulbifer hydrolyticus]|uniref:3-deoxy-D-manno-octulosonic acid transferase n=1 Tax=Microbulbifer hydrolyticus TaxID=48074 RepID=A0A6P1TA12_9GAMM|nr:lipid IV(A) 3-deoxy-D-manno-octulosonic acid transferase [Microbulbifer hydrolyticus]MBB5211127.1 3-deoxy-D-manno-octulosonic-acid transferase [Microbulbifer hydrolyticus]QHQ38089.1 3-deoxy-D-manno-octulosonic acid transferase [Microbulbifer hydrolyticus]
MRHLYTWFFRLSLPLMLLHLWWRGRADPAYRKRWSERFGLVPKRPETRRRWRERFGVVPDRASRAPLIWIHSVSVGETLAAVPLIESLAARHPRWQWLVTTTTPTGSQRVHDALEPILNGRLLHYYLPFDLPECLTPFLDALRPNILVSMETELWPNLLAVCSKRQIPAVLVNGRLSEKSARGYGHFSRLSREMLSHLTRVVAQYPADAERFIKLGVPLEKVSAVGNIKFDLHIGSGLVSEAQALSHQWQSAGSRPVWLAASTHAGEDEIVLQAYAALCAEFPQLLLVLVPRHPTRFDSVARLCRDQGLRVVRRSDGTPPGMGDRVLLGDTMGELLRFYGACDVAFVGGSLVPVGGHNMIEPAAWGVPVVCGPYLHNFSTVSGLMEEVGGLVVCEDAAGLAQQVGDWLRDDQGREVAGARAREVAAQNSGALARTVSEVETLMQGY